eukprot:1145191-Pelagomonas_calceolata.AAC.7
MDGSGPGGPLPWHPCLRGFRHDRAPANGRQSRPEPAGEPEVRTGVYPTGMDSRHGLQVAEEDNRKKNKETLENTSMRGRVLNRIVHCYTRQAEAATSLQSMLVHQ